MPHKPAASLVPASPTIPRVTLYPLTGPLSPRVTHARGAAAPFNPSSRHHNTAQRCTRRRCDATRRTRGRIATPIFGARGLAPHPGSAFLLVFRRYRVTHATPLTCMPRTPIIPCVGASRAPYAWQRRTMKAKTMDILPQTLFSHARRLDDERQSAWEGRMQRRLLIVLAALGLVLVIIG